MSREENDHSRAAVIYHCIETGEDPASDDLLMKLRLCCQEKGWRMVGEYIDYRSREGVDFFEYDRLIADAHRRRFGLLLFQSLGVLCPGGCRDAATDLSRLFKLGIDVKSLEEPELDTTAAHGRLVIELINSLARLERQHVSRRITRGMSRARKRGKKLGRPQLPKELQREGANRASAMATRRNAASDIALLADRNWTVFDTSWPL